MGTEGLWSAWLGLHFYTRHLAQATGKSRIGLESGSSKCGHWTSSLSITGSLLECSISVPTPALLAQTLG